MRYRKMGRAIAIIAAMVVPTSAAAAQPQWRLVEELRIGGEADTMTMFSDVRGIVAGPEGHIFVLDARAQQLRGFDRGGRFVTLAARRGQGPGEIANANGMLVVRDTVWVNDPSNGRWSAYSATDGRYLRQLALPITGYGFLWDAGVDAEGRIADPISVPGGRPDPATGEPTFEPRLRRVRLDGRGADTVPARLCEQTRPPTKWTFTGRNPGVGNRVVGIPFLARPVSVLDGRGGVWCSPNDEYLLVHRSLAGGDTLHTVRRAYTRLRVSAAERDSAVERVRTSLASYQVVDVDYSLIPNVHPVFRRLDADDRGRIWARRTTPGQSSATFDLYDGAGRAAATVTTTIPFVRHLPIHVRGEHVYGVVFDADDVPYVVRARIVAGSGRD